MFQFTWLPSCTYLFSTGYKGVTPCGFPHSDIPGSGPAFGSPRLFADGRVLLRLLAPRHPPCALYSLTSHRRAVHVCAITQATHYLYFSDEINIHIVNIACELYMFANASHVLSFWHVHSEHCLASYTCLLTQAMYSRSGMFTL